MDTRLITVSATYGAGGSVIAPRVAERVGLPFADRLIPARAEPGEGMDDAEREHAARTSFLSRLAYLSGSLGLPTPEDLGGRNVREEVEAGLDRLVEMGGAVILGRGSAIVLARHPRAFHVRLDGPEELRVARAMLIEGIDEPTARERQAATDRARARYVSRLYSRDADDPRLYHLVLDSTAIEAADAVEIIAAASSAFWRRSGT